MSPAARPSFASFAPHVLLFLASSALVGCPGTPAPSDAGPADTGARDAAVDGGLPPPGPVITTCPGDALPSLAAGACEATAGGPSILVTADVLTPGEVFRGGQVLLDATGSITCVGCDCSAGATGATTIVCPDGVLSPGLINAHEHMYELKHLERYLPAARQAGIATTVFVASPEFTLKGTGDKGEPMMSDNFATILEAKKLYPTEIIPFCTLDPHDDDKLERLKRHVAAGCMGLKLYSGHSNFFKDHGPFDAPGMD